MRGRRQDRREERQDDRSFGRRGSGNTRYQMREKLVSIGDDFLIENEAGQKAFKVDGKALRIRDTLKFEDAHGAQARGDARGERRAPDPLPPASSDGGSRHTCDSPHRLLGRMGCP